MSDIPINKMNFNQLREEVERLSDEIVRMKRYYDDALYNLDDDNLAFYMVKEKGDMKSSIVQNAEKIEMTVENGEHLKAQITQTAEYIKQTVEDSEKGLKAQITQTANSIKNEVSATYETKDDAKTQYGKLNTTIEQTAYDITSTVSETYVTKDDADDEYETIYSKIKQTAKEISSVVAHSANLKAAIQVTSEEELTDQEKTYVINTYNSAGIITSSTYYYYNSLSEGWEIISDGSIYSLFTQTDDGFVLDGNTVITKNLKLSGKVTWDMSNSPVQTQYSANGSSWHTDFTGGDQYMQMSFDGGINWSNPTKVVGSDGKDGRNGKDGSNAAVTAENIFNVLTDDGKSQGLFPAFYNGGTHLFINAEYIKAGVLSGVTVEAAKNGFKDQIKLEQDAAGNPRLNFYANNGLVGSIYPNPSLGYLTIDTSGVGEGSKTVFGGDVELHGNVSGIKLKFG